MPDERPPRRPAPRLRVPAGWRLAGAALGLLILFAAVGLGTSTTSSDGTQAHRGLVRAEATAVTIALGWLVVMGLLVAVWALTAKGGPPAPRPQHGGLGRHRALILMMTVVVLAFLLYDLADPGGRGRSVDPAPRPPAARRPPGDPGNGIVDARTVGVGLIVAVALTLLAIAAYIRWERRRLGALPRHGSRDESAVDALTEAIDEAIADLDSDLDPRRAVIVAYARMEEALRAHGVPRLPWEAPTEYLDRVLRELGRRAGAVDRLTALYQEARFSTHEVDERMRHEAVGALQELRAGLAVPA